MKVVEVIKNSQYHNLVIDFILEQYDTKNRGRDFWLERFNKSNLEKIGYTLEINSQIVGFIGLLYSNNLVGLSTWYVIESYRNYSVPFLSKVLNNLKKYPLVNSSPNPNALKIFTKLYRFNHNIEYVGFPKLIFGFSNAFNNYFYFGKRLNVCFHKDISLFALIYFSIKYKKICLGLNDNKKKLIFGKKINVLCKNINYSFPLSFYGDIFE